MAGCDPWGSQGAMYAQCRQEDSSNLWLYGKRMNFFDSQLMMLGYDMRRSFVFELVQMACWRIPNHNGFCGITPGCLHDIVRTGGYYSRYGIGRAIKGCGSNLGYAAASDWKDSVQVVLNESVSEYYQSRLSKALNWAGTYWAVLRTNADDANSYSITVQCIALH